MFLETMVDPNSNEINVQLLVFTFGTRSPRLVLLLDKIYGYILLIKLLYILYMHQVFFFTMNFVFTILVLLAFAPYCFIVVCAATYDVFNVCLSFQCNRAFTLRKQIFGSLCKCNIVFFSPPYISFVGRKMILTRNGKNNIMKNVYGEIKD